MEKELSLTRFEWFETLPPDLAEKAVKYSEEYCSDLLNTYSWKQHQVDTWRSRRFGDLLTAITDSFPWEKTDEGFSFWDYLTDEIEEPGHSFFKVGESYQLRDSSEGWGFKITDIQDGVIYGEHRETGYQGYTWHSSGIYFDIQGVRDKQADLVPHDFTRVQPVYAWKKPTTAERALILD